jgi:hypothetical protein
VSYVVKSHSATNNLVRYGRKIIFFYFEKRYSLLQRQFA